MPISLLLSALLAVQEPQVQPPVATENPTPVRQAAPFSTPFVVAEPARLALTPKIDGKLEEEEWDPIIGEAGMKGFFQWEPRKLHVAATVPSGHDLILSLDLKSNGWLVGADNLEIRVGTKDGVNRVMGRLVDATQVAGPQWVELPGIGMAAVVASSTGEAGTTYEVTLNDPNLGLLPRDPDSKLSLRMDSVPSEAAAIEPYIPRVMTPVTLAFQRAAALAPALRWKTEGAGVAVMPGDSVRLRETFNGTDKLGIQRLSLRTEGFARRATNELTVPFPGFDNKGRAFVDYGTRVQPEAELGYRILRGELTSSDGVTALLQTSYRIAPVVDFDLVRERFTTSDQPKTVRLTYFLRSNSPRRVDGTITLLPPDNFRVVSGNDKGFIISSPRGGVRRVFELEIPAGTKGVIPILVRTEIGGKSKDETIYLNVE